MKGLLFILFSTFLVGMATGVFIYFMSGLNEPLIDLPGDELTSGFEITADAYGGCQMLGSCPSYHIDESGNYLYVILKRGGESERTEGKLSSLELRTLKEELKKVDLEKIEASTFSGTCPIAFDGVAYVYQIRIDEIEYRIDTCQHDVAGEALFNFLEERFSHLNN